MSTTRLTELVPGVWVATAREYDTISTVLLDGVGGAVVIDPAWHPDELAAIPADLAELAVVCVAGVATHEHYDHVLWHDALGQVPRWTSPTTAGTVAAHRAEVIAPAAQFLTPDLLDLAGRLDPLPDALLPWRGTPVSIVTHDAHAPGHLALLHEEAGVLIAGDMLSDVELPMPADDDVTLEVYLAGLASLRESVGRARWLIPGHGTPTAEPMRRYDADMRYLTALLAHERVDDPRLANPGMADLHAANVRRASAEQ